MSELTERQRAQISQNFRAAKALLARKLEPPSRQGTPDYPSPGRKRFCGSVPSLCQGRVPLGLIDGNALGAAADIAPPGLHIPVSQDTFDQCDDLLFEEIDRLCEERKPRQEQHYSPNARDADSGNPVLVRTADSTPEEIPEHLRKLNDSQREAATSDTNKPLLILAGPGSGKTSTMVARVLTLLNEGVQPANILAMTFTTAAASEMRDRVAAVVGKSVSKDLAISTFHSFCLQLCRSHAEKLDRTPEFLIYGTGQQRKAVIEATRLANTEHPEDVVDVKCTVWKDKAKKWQQFVAQAKAAGRSAADMERAGNMFGAAILKHYEAILTSCNALDYHDFISCAVRLLRDHPDVLDECQKSWPYILVDEFQDTSAMQYAFLRFMSTHNRVTVVGDDDQSIFSFNGADSAGFNSFRKDFPEHKEVRLHQNYRSTGCIVEAARCLIQKNAKRCGDKHIKTENIFGDKIVVRECRNEEAQCAFIVDAILRHANSDGNLKSDLSNFAVLYRRQVTGRMFQKTFRSRNIPFNLHGVAFYRKKVIKTVIALLWTALQETGDSYHKRAFKALVSSNNSEAKKAADYVEKQAKYGGCTFLKAAETIFTAKVSGTFTRSQLSQGRKALSTIEMLRHLVDKERSLSSLITAAVSFLPQRSAFETRAVVDESGGKLLNEDDDPRTTLSYLLDDVSDYLSEHQPDVSDEFGCKALLRAFLNHLLVREADNFRSRRQDNNSSVTLTTMHQSKGLEWDTVFIVQANELETPLLHVVGTDEHPASLEEERRLFYVAMTRARKRLHISYIVVNPQKQILQPSRFLKELPSHLLQFEGVYDSTKPDTAEFAGGFSVQIASSSRDDNKPSSSDDTDGLPTDTTAFLKSFNVEARAMVASIFHCWAKKPAFQDPKRLVNKVGFVIDERLRSRNVKGKDVLHALKCSLGDEGALLFADHVIKWEKLPLHERALLQADRNEHFQQKCCERTMSVAAATAKQISYLQSLGCTIVPSSRLHASKLIEQYKAL